MSEYKQSVKSKELSGDLRKRIVLRLRYGVGIENQFCSFRGLKEHSGFMIHLKKTFGTRIFPRGGQPPELRDGGRKTLVRAPAYLQQCTNQACMTEWLHKRESVGSLQKTPEGL